MKLPENFLTGCGGNSGESRNQSGAEGARKYFFRISQAKGQKTYDFSRVAYFMQLFYLGGQKKCKTYFIT